MSSKKGKNKKLSKQVPAQELVKDQRTPNSRSPLIKQLALVVFALSFLIYSNTITHGYVLDDFSQIKNNKVTKQGASAIPLILKTSYRYGLDSGDDELYRPLSMVLFAAMWSASPDNPTLYHFVNVLMYAITCSLLFLVLVKLFDKRFLFVAFAASVLFAAHPLHTEVVANIKSADEIMGFAFMFASLYFVLKYGENEKMLSLILSAVMFFLALLSKENTIIMAVIGPLALFMFRSTTFKKLILVAAPLIVVSAIYLYIRSQVLNGLTSFGVSQMDNALIAAPDMITQKANAIYILGKYLWLMLFPTTLLCDYSFNHIPLVKAFDVKVLFTFVICLALAVYAALVLIKKVKSNNEFGRTSVVAFSILFFFAGILPVSNILILIRCTMAERFVFMPLLGFCLALAFGIQFMLAREKEVPVNATLQQFFKINGGASFLLILVLVLYTGKTITRAAQWENEDILYKADIEKAPNSAKLHYYYANHFVSNVKEKKTPDDQKEAVLNDAINKAQRCIEILPKYYEAYFVIGEAYGAKNDAAKSLEWYQKAMATGYPPSLVLNNIGNAYFKLNQFDTAIVYLTKAVNYNPRNAQSWSNLGSSYTQKQNFVEAIKCYEKAIQVDPGYAEAMMNMGSAYGLMKDYDNAIRSFDRALQLDGNNATLNYYMGITLRFKGDNNASQQYMAKACQLNPQFCGK